MKFYQRIKDLREDKEKDQIEIANLIGVSEATYRRYEQGKTIIPLDKAEILSKYYDASIDYIAGLTNDKGGLHCNIITKEEKNHLNNWRQLTERQRRRISEEIEDYIEEQPKTKEKKSVI